MRMKTREPEKHATKNGNIRWFVSGLVVGRIIPVVMRERKIRSAPVHSNAMHNAMNIIMVIISIVVCIFQYI